MAGYLFVHAHPDDETILTGATMAKFAATGDPVTLVTCTRGERGEVIPEALRTLMGDRPALGAYRAGELTAAMLALQIQDFGFLGADQGLVFEDSGMAWAGPGQAVAAPDTDSAAFSKTPIADVAALIAELICARQPDVVVTYDATGGYGHPDHVHAHHATMRSIDLAAAAGHQVRQVWWPVFDAAAERAAITALHQQGYPTADPAGPLAACYVAADQIDHTVDASDFVAAKRAALAAHHTQIVVDDQAFSLSNAQYWPITGVEHYQVRNCT